MKVSVRTSRFDTSSPVDDGSFRGRDFADWLSEQLAGWKCHIDEKDWGWAVSATKDRYAYLIGVYDHDTDDVNDAGPLWVLRIYNQKDWRSWFKSWIKYTPPVAQQEVVDEIVGVLNSADGMTEITIQPMD